MSVTYGEYENDPDIDGTLVAQQAAAWLISDTGLEADEVHLDEIDNDPGRLRIHTPDGDTMQYTDMEFDTFRMARLAYGLWDRCGPFDQPEGRAVPIEIAADGQAAVAAYLRVGNGYPNSRRYVAQQMDVAEQTVSNYCSKVRWDPE